ncbi:MAG: hypothetical protein ACOWYE_15655 [Desulfatiglandales bacterium]
MTDQKIDLKSIDGKIQEIKKAAQELMRMGDSFPALSRNTTRLLASTKMLELAVSDAVDL